MVTPCFLPYAFTFLIKSFPIMTALSDENDRRCNRFLLSSVDFPRCAHFWWVRLLCVLEIVAWNWQRYLLCSDKEAPIKCVPVMVRQGPPEFIEGLTPRGCENTLLTCFRRHYCENPHAGLRGHERN